MRNSLIAALLFLVGLKPAPARAQAAEEQKAKTDRDWSHIVITNDNIAEFLKNAPRLSIIGAVPTPEAKRAPAPSAAATPTRAHGRTVRLTFEIAGECGGFKFGVSSWCPMSISDGGIVGGLYKEVRIQQGDQVEMTLVNGPFWTPGQVAFTLTAADVIEDCLPDADGKPKPLSGDEAAKCAQFPQFGVDFAVAPRSARTVTFAAKKAGTYKYYDGFSRSGYGLLVVE